MKLDMHMLAAAMQSMHKVPEEIEMASRTRSHSPRSGSGAPEFEQHSRALMNLLLHVVADKSGSGQQRKQNRIVIVFAKAMLATLRSARRDMSMVHLADLNELDDAQFERVIEGLRYLRCSAPLSGRGKQHRDCAH